jgi:hypothetical protein
MIRNKMLILDPFLNNKDGTRATIQSKYHRGEKLLWCSDTNKNTWAVDGYVESDHGIKVYEFNGDYWHKGCPHCSNEIYDAKWSAKLMDIDFLGYQLEVMWECQFDKLLPTWKDIKTPLIPYILKPRLTENEIIEGIRSEEIFGFIVSDISTPDHIVQKMRDFPPIIKREIITKDFLTPFMKKQIEIEKPNLKEFKRETLIQCFNAKNKLLITPLAQYYLSKGLIISNIQKFIQYIPRNSLRPFVKKVTAMRIEAEKNNMPTKGNTAKIYGNSGYGKVIKYKYIFDILQFNFSFVKGCLI